MNILFLLVIIIKGQDKYVNKQCVGSDEFITANGTATLEFTREIMKNLQLKPKEEIGGVSVL